MATFQEQKAPSNSTDALFRAWVKSVIDGLIAVGLVQTADTGQINTTTVLAPTAGNQNRGYAIFQLNDTLQSTSPYFFKFEFGSGTGGANTLWMGVTVGHSTNGSGTLSISTGSVTVHTPYGTGGMNAPSTSPFDMNYSGSSGRFVMTLFRGSSGPLIIGFERSHDNSGADTDEYGTLFISSGSNGGSNAIQYTLLKSGSATPVTPGIDTIISMNTSLGSSVFNNKRGLSPLFPFVGKFGNPMIGMVGLKSGDWVTDAETFTATLYGSSRTFMVISLATALTSPRPTKFAMRWD
ncbi:MAG TPA: hypothetical protein VIL74_20580 [Pyrinomonadaceae bacterium]|jgi:hypothetical protein